LTRGHAGVSIHSVQGKIRWLGVIRAFRDPGLPPGAIESDDRTRTECAPALRHHVHNRFGIASALPVTMASCRSARVRRVPHDGSLTMADLTISGTGGDDTIVITATGTDSGSYSINGGAAIAFSGITSLEVTGGDGNDTLRIVNPDVGVLAPSGGIFYQGGGNPADALEVLGGTADQFTYTAGATPDAGTFAYSGSWGTSTLTFAGIAPTTDTVAASDFVINGTSGADAFVVSDGGVVNGFQTTQVSAPAMESIRFANKTNVTINGIAGSDTIIFNNPTVAAGLVTMSVVNVGAVSQTGAVNYTNLSLISGAVNLSGDNDVTNLSAFVASAGDFNFHDVDDITLTLTGAAEGVRTVNGDIQITTTNGSIFVANTAAAADVSAGVGDVILSAGSVGAADSAVQLDASANITTGSAEVLSIVADHIELGTGATLMAIIGRVQLAPYSSGTLINLGGPDAANTLGLSDAELDGINASSLSIGGANASAISFTGLITPVSFPKLILFTSANIQDNNAGNDVTVGTLHMTASTGIGTGGNPIETTVNNLEAQTTTGGINIVESDGLVLGGSNTDGQRALFVDVSGDINVTANGSIVFGDLFLDLESVRAGSTSGNVTLNAIGATSDVSSTIAVDAIIAPAGNVTVNAGHDILLGSAGFEYDNDILANGSITLNAGRDVFVGGNAEVISDTFSNNTGGSVSITAGRDINVSDVNGGAAAVAAGGAGGGDVTLTTGLGGSLFLTSNTSNAVFAGSGDVMINTDRMILPFGTGITAPHSVTIQQRSPDWSIKLGSAEDSDVSAMELTDAELDRISTAILRLGDPANTGDIIVLNPISAGSSYATLALRTAGAIVGQLGILPHLSVQNLALQAAEGIGSSSGLETTVQQLAFSNSTSGNVDIFNHNGLTIGPVDTLMVSDGGLNSGLLLRADGPLTIASNLTVPGTMTLQTIDAAGTGQDLRVLPGVTVRTTANTMFLHAGDDFILPPGATVQALNAIHITVDGSSDAGVGATANLNGSLIAGTFLDVFGGPDQDVLIGSAANETLDGGGGADSMSGGGGNDTYLVDTVGDAVIENAGEGTDTANLSINYTLPPNVENLALIGGSDLQGYGNGLANTITGNTGNNLIDGGIGADTMMGGAGNDTYFADNTSDTVVEAAASGNDSVFASVNFTLAPNVETLVMQGAADLQGYGNILVNGIFGNSGNNLIDGGGGADLMVGGMGNDTYFTDDPSDATFELAGQGNDAVFATSNYGLAADVETLVLQGGSDLQGYGNNGVNTLYGNTGNNLLNGAGGADTMVGGLGNDTYFVDNVGDGALENSGEGTDAVFASVNYTLAANVEALVQQGGGNLIGTGNALTNSLFGNTGNNTLNGGANTDTLTGNAGNDTFVFNAGQGNGDTVVDFTGNGAAAGDTLQFVGYGGGATFTNIDATHWQVNYNGGASHDIITFSNAAAIDPTDYSFV
jgi:Ca2+-binding RTX toxin-like protein